MQMRFIKKWDFRRERYGASDMDLSRTRFQLKFFIILILLLAFISCAWADTRSVTVRGNNSTTWTITRHTENITFDYSQYVQGTISPVEYRDRTLSPYHSSYQEVNVNDIRMRDRTSAFIGNYASEEWMTLRADATNPSLFDFVIENRTLTGQFTEEWPVILRSSKSMRYSGREINNREFAGNNLDFASSDLLYNSELSKDTDVDMLLTRMNATVIATDDAILSADFMPTKEMYYDTRTYTTGIADLKYRLTGSSAELKPGGYPALSEGEERYVGAYNITRSIHIKSDFPYYAQEEDWLPCCPVSGYDLNPLYGKDLGVSAREVFDCTCYLPPAEEEITKTAART